VVNEVDSEGFTSSSVVSLTSDLDRASSLIFNTISRRSVAQILSAFISLSGGEFLHVSELTRFVAKLSKESVLSGRSVDTSILHSFVQIRSVLVKNLRVSLGHHLLELLNRESASWGRGIWLRGGNWGHRLRCLDGSRLRGGLNWFGCLDRSGLRGGLNWSGSLNRSRLNGSWLRLNRGGSWSLNWGGSRNRLGDGWGDSRGSIDLGNGGSGTRGNLRHRRSDSRS
jgi:hypothetical protein